MQGPLELHHELSPCGVEHYREEAQALLSAARDGDTEAEARLAAVHHNDGEAASLVDALDAVAAEHGHASWTTFEQELAGIATRGVRPVARIGTAPPETYAEQADALTSAVQQGEQDAVVRLRGRVPRLADLDDAAIGTRATSDDARVCIAREYGFRTWSELVQIAEYARRTHYTSLAPETPWKRAVAAIRAGDSHALRRLLDEHPGLPREDPGMTLLAAAAQPEAGEVPQEIVSMLIEAGSELNGPLGIAACFNKADMVEWLLDAGADPAATDIGPVTALQAAVYHGAEETTDVLVRRAGLHPDAFYLAAGAGDLKRVDAWFTDDGQLRLEAFAERPNLTDVGWPPRPPLSDDPRDLLAEALAFAAQLGRTEVCENLLDRGADPARAPLYGVTPLHLAAAAGRLETVKALIRRGAPLNARDDLHQGTPLGWALHSGRPNEETVAFLRNRS